ncbi:hypothetical protein [Desertimonas flava]|nr:hypothetical protein [Desertimonas flava]
MARIGHRERLADLLLDEHIARANPEPEPVFDETAPFAPLVLAVLEASPDTKDDDVHHHHQGETPQDRRAQARRQTTPIPA